MNILVSQLPDSLEVGGRRYPIDTDFRSALLTILAFEDNELTSVEKQSIMLTNLYDDVPDDVGEAVKQAGWFLDGGRESSPEDGGPRVYSFEQDSNLIFAAFKSTHNVNLQDVGHMHWWVFLALFMDLGHETTFCSLTALRKRVKTGEATKYEKEAARRMGSMFKLDEHEDMSIEELEALRKFEELSRGGRDDKKEQAHKV